MCVCECECVHVFVWLKSCIAHFVGTLICSHIVGMCQGLKASSHSIND